MNITIAEASKLTGKSISTLNRYCKSGKLTYTQENNQRMLNIAELERVFGKLERIGDTQQSDAMSDIDNHQLEIEIEYLKKENDTLKSQLKDANEREQKLFELTDRLTKQNETRMLQPPPKHRRTLTDILNFFRTPDQPTHQSEEQ